jgi:hypothetical protein
MHNKHLRLGESDAVTSKIHTPFVRGAAFGYSGHSPVRIGFLEAMDVRADEHRVPRKLLIPLASLLSPDKLSPLARRATIINQHWGPDGRGRSNQHFLFNTYMCAQCCNKVPY